MEEDIKRLKEKINNIKKYDTYRYDWTETDVQTVENLIKAYKEIEYKYNKALSDLVQAEHKNKELKEENEVWKNSYYEQKEFNNKQVLYITEKFIPVSLVEEKIEEYTKLLKNCNRFSDVDRIKSINERILAYKELLEKRK